MKKVEKKIVKVIKMNCGNGNGNGSCEMIPYLLPYCEVKKAA